MRKMLKVVAMVTLLSGSVHVFAAALNDDMDTLSQGLSMVQTTTDAVKMKGALEDMRIAALDAQQATPPKLEGQPADSEAMQDYRRGFDILVSQIDNAIRLMKEGKTEEAQKAAGELKVTRDTWHHKYR
ncbi:TPA: cytochrome b562 [Salmonella enterica]|nr:cytochrome b562 [Salmonella enterica]